MESILQNMVAALGAPRMLDSDAAGRLTIARWRHSDAEVSTHDPAAVAVVVNLSNCQRVEYRDNGVWRSQPFSIGSFTVVDPELGAALAIRGEADVLQLHMPLTAVADAVGGSRVPRIPARFQATDVAVERCAMQAIAAVRTGEAAHRLLLSQLTQDLGAALIGAPSPDRTSTRGGLSPTALRRVRELIEARVAAAALSSLTLRELAQQANLSEFHFARQFRSTVGTSPYAYVLDRRLRFARALILCSELPVKDVASRAGFRSPAHFGAAFRRWMGVSPGALQQAAASAPKRAEGD